MHGFMRGPQQKWAQLTLSNKMSKCYPPRPHSATTTPHKWGGGYMLDSSVYLRQLIKLLPSLQAVTFRVVATMSSFRHTQANLNWRWKVECLQYLSLTHHPGAGGLKDQPEPDRMRDFLLPVYINVLFRNKIYAIFGFSLRLPDCTSYCAILAWPLVARHSNWKVTEDQKVNGIHQSSLASWWAAGDPLCEARVLAFLMEGELRRSQACVRILTQALPEDVFPLSCF